VRRVAAVSLFAVALLLVTVAPSHAWGGGGHGGHGGHGFGHHGFHGHGAIVVGPSFWWDPWWYYPPPYYAPYYVYPQPVVQEPPVYVERPSPPQSYWYYCPSAKAYYPTAPTCREAWIKVPPR